MDPRWRRPRRNEPPSLGTVISAAAVVYGTYRLASWAWTSWYNDGSAEEERKGQRQASLPQGEGIQSSGFSSRPVDAVQAPAMNSHRWRIRRQRMARCRDEVMKALEGFLPTLRRAIENRTNTAKETQALKDLRAQRSQEEGSHDNPNEQMRRREEKDLWEKIKIRAITRMVATAYAQCILFLVVTVQVNLLGGKLFAEQLQNSSSASSMSIDSVASDRMNAYGESHKLVLQYTYKYFFERGIVSLIDSVERAVSVVLETWDVSDPSSLNISREAFDQAINDIRAAEEKGRVSSRSRRPRSLLRFLMPPTETFNENVPDELARWILDETWDLLESPVLIDAQQDCLKATFDRMRDRYWGEIFESEEETADIPRHAASRTVTRPLAYVITRLKHTSKSFFKSQQQPDEGSILGMATPRFAVNSYCAEMEMLPSVLELADVSFN